MKDQSDETGLKVLGFIWSIVAIGAILGFFINQGFYQFSLTGLYILALISVVGIVCNWLDNRQGKKK